MKIWIRRSLVGLAMAVVGAGALVALGAYLGERKLHRHIEVAVTPIAFRSDAAGIARGAYLFRSRGCAECHGADGAGHVVIDDGQGMLVRAPNITPVEGGVVAAYAPVDWVRTLRHGIKPDGRPILVMPSEDYSHLTDVDVAAVVAYVRQLPRAAGQRAIVQLPLPVKVLYAAGVVRDAAEKIDQGRTPTPVVAEGVTAEHGAYVATACIGCHREGLVGGKIEGAPPGWPPAARLAPGSGSVMPRYRDAQAFAAMLKTGKRPDGSAVSQVMPFVSLREMNEVDVQALYLHLTTMKAPG